MMEYLSSMYIDDEMDLDEKKQFLEKIRSDQAFYTLTLDLLTQEELLLKQPALPEPVCKKIRQAPSVRSSLGRILKPLGLTAAGFSAAMLLFFAVFQPQGHPVPNNNRFVLFEPAAEQVELTGSFTGWQRISMKRLGNSGYWELNLPVVSGEHRFAYILNNDRRIADPTLPAREKDDFGGENSILNVENHI